MKRALSFSLLIITLDQILKWYFQTNFHHQKIMLLDKFGFTYVTNPGLYVSLTISDLSIFILQIFVFSVWILLLKSVKYYQNIFDRSLLIDFSFAFLTTGLFGNLLLDKIMFGYIRDYLVIPFGVANLADFCGLIALTLLSIQIYRSSDFRNFLFRGIQPVKLAVNE